ncbi:hypothetical protein BX666DRAFT_1911309 [Dichotomocladium elegans]|nr:hypothetical protein BX666DRAFT_1911309 [Dichotomocladium elegans]
MLAHWYVSIWSNGVIRYFLHAHMHACTYTKTYLFASVGCDSFHFKFLHIHCAICCNPHTTCFQSWVKIFRSETKKIR